MTTFLRPGTGNFPGDSLFPFQATGYFQAAQQNRPEAEFKLGKFCEQGLGVPENTSEAIKWYQLAIAKGDSEAEESLRALQK